MCIRDRCETGRKFVCRLSDHKRGEGNRTTNSLYGRLFIEDNHKFVNPLEEYEIVKVVNNTVERKLREESEILKEREIEIFKRSRKYEEFMERLGVGDYLSLIHI